MRAGGEWSTSFIRRQEVERSHNLSLIQCSLRFTVQPLKAVGESVAGPIGYYRNKVGSLLTLPGVMRDRHLKQFVFSSAHRSTCAKIAGDVRRFP